MNIPIGRLFLRRLKNTPEVRCVAVSISVTSPTPLPSWISIGWILVPCHDHFTFMILEKKNKTKRIRPPPPRLMDRSVKQIMWLWSLNSCFRA